MLIKRKSKKGGVNQEEIQKSLAKLRTNKMSEVVYKPNTIFQQQKEKLKSILYKPKEGGRKRKVGRNY